MQINMQYAVGRIVIGNLIFTSANIAVASSANDKTISGTMLYTVEVAFIASGKRFASRFKVGESEIIEVRSDHADMLLVGTVQVHKTGSAKTVQIKAKINNGGLTVVQSTLISTLGQSSGMVIDTEQGPVDLNLLVTELAQ